ncbi:10237_t:CDS:2 [Ambispora leptoticha]|uniref:10237_t:CDS:1 n=1 Tax=Ambispora leptoticha TaxID=144679 RepID=A0A9N9C8B9_9GLOM|nr:10237_t:CDS:2 [Ambispora leptoticha]
MWAGSLAFNMTTHCPNTEFLGVEIKPIYPSQIKSANVHFYQYDLMQLEQLCFEEKSFDMVRITHMHLTITEDNHVIILEKMLKSIEGSAVPDLENMLLATEQLINVRQDIRIIRLGPSGGISGELFLTNIEEFFTGNISEMLSELLVMTSKEYEQFWQQFNAECIKLGTGIPLTKTWDRKLLFNFWLSSLKKFFNNFHIQSKSFTTTPYTPDLALIEATLIYLHM